MTQPRVVANTQNQGWLGNQFKEGVDGKNPTGQFTGEGGTKSSTNLKKD